MGYSHYWSHPDIDPTAWAAFTADVKRIILMATHAGIALAGPMGTGDPEVSDARISLNGSEERGGDFETFEVTTDGTEYDFCKTGLRPYDQVVCAILLAAYTRIDGVAIWSDGDINGDDWAEGRLLYAMALDRTAPRVIG